MKVNGKNFSGTFINEILNFLCYFACTIVISICFNFINDTYYYSPQQITNKYMTIIITSLKKLFYLLRAKSIT